MKTESTNIVKDIEIVSDRATKLTNLILESKDDNKSLEKKNKVHFSILDVLHDLSHIKDVLSGELKKVEELREVLSEMLAYYPYKSQETSTLPVEEEKE